MNSKNPIEEHIDHILEIGDSIDDVKASPFFKEKMMNRLFEARNEQEKLIFAWFTPQLQLAALTCIFVLNIYAFIQYSQSNYDTQVSNFAKTYTLGSNDSDSLFN